MIYKLICANCNKENLVSADHPIIEWTCKCGTTSLTSLPMHSDGSLITDPTKASSIVGKKSSAIVIKGKPI